jgi:glycosyltransferase involved in cell wall biosynthesis
MHILYIHQHFATPRGSTGTRSYEFARRWVEAGHKVTLITGYYDIGGLEPRKGLMRKQTVDGINVIIVGSKYSNKQAYLLRIVSFLSFTLLSIYAGLRVKGVDVIYATSTPLTVGIPAIVLKWLKRTPFVFEVRDQWPEVPIELGIIKNKMFVKLLLWLEKAIYEQSSAVVALSPGMADGIRRVIGRQKSITVIPNCCDTDRFKPEIDGSGIRREHGWQDKFVVIHFGAMGKANGLRFLVDAAGRLAENADIHFVLIGNGSERQRIAEDIKQRGLGNIELLDSKPKEQLPKYVAACDLSAVVFADYPILQSNSANKFFDSLSAGKPVLLNYSGWQREILEANNAGMGCQLYAVDEFVQKILQLKENSARTDKIKMGKNARALAEREFDRVKLAAHLENVLLQALKRA